jgi:hypothetical protein
MDDDDDDTSVMMMIPLLWATKMMEANNEFLAEISSIQPDAPKSVVKRMLERRMLGRGSRH